MQILKKLFVCLSLATICAGALAADERPDLTGQVVEAGDAPVAKASVFIYTAGPKQGTSNMCPSCYADCQKKAQTDAQGNFKIESLDPALRFRLLVVATGHESQFVPKVDPTNGLQKITLTALSETALKSPLRIKGVVVDEHGKVVPGAIINPEGVGMGEMTRWGGNDDEVEPLAVADDAGQFVLFCKSNNVDTVHATAEGRGVAKQWVILKPGGDYFLKLPEGVTLTGQILREGQPVKGVSVAATTTDRECGHFLDCDAVTTDGDGRFMLMNVPPNRDFIVYASMKSLQGNGILPAKTFTSGDSGLSQDLGKLAIQPAFTVSGRVVLSDGKPVPAGTRIFLGRENSLDSQEISLDPDGKFEFKGVPAESITMSARIKGYRLSKRNPSLDRLNGAILGRVPGDVTDLTILLEPGDWKRADDDADGDDEYPVNKPLRGVKL
jgi:hypothetical protein